MSLGGLLAIYTDGVTDTFGSDGNSFGLERLIEVIGRNRTLAVDKIIAEVLKSVQSFSGTDVFHDDFTLVLVRRPSG